MRRHPHRRHVKLLVIVHGVRAGRLRLALEDLPEFVFPVDCDATQLRPGKQAMLHLTKRGEAYLYWLEPKEPTRSQLKRQRLRGRA